MKKQTCIRLLYLAGFLCLFGLIVKIAADFFTYHQSLTSAPFYVWVLADCAEMGLPALLFFAAAIILKKRWNRQI